MSPKRVLITGCGGMLGNAIYPYFVQQCGTVTATDRDASEPWLNELDVRDEAGLTKAYEELQPDLVLHLAAETDLEYCENNPNIAEDINATATRTIAGLTEEHGSTLVYISTAGVFDGKKDGFYTEEDQPKPIMTYGQTKFDGENHVREICSKYYVIRAGWMVGGGQQKDHKFVSKILEQIVDNRKTIHAVSDKLGTPTYTHDFANNLFALLDSEQYGTYHMVCEGSGSRYDVAREILNICKRNDIELKEVDSDFFKDEYFAPRPRSEMMINNNLAKIGLNRMRPWKIALRDYIHMEFSHAVNGYDKEIKLSVFANAAKDRRQSNSDRRAAELAIHFPDRRGAQDRRAL